MIKAPFTADQVKSLNEFQETGMMHPFTCAKCPSDLIATPDGWKCSTPGCDYTQDWCHEFMADWSWKTMSEHTRKTLGLE